MNQARADERRKIDVEGGQVNALSNKLSQLEAQEEGWIYRYWHNNEGRLARFFWMNPWQVSMLHIYGDILVVDVSEGRNIYNMYLTTIIIIDSENKSRDVAFCLSERQDGTTFEWIFRLVQYAMCKESNQFTKLTAIFSDRALAIVSAVAEIWPDVFHGTCLWHLQGNLKKNIQGLLGQRRWSRFMSDFWQVYRMGSRQTFEQAWAWLLDEYPETIPYLQSEVYPDRDKWAWAWVGTRFTCGLRTTGRVETEHKNYKLLGISRDSTLVQVFDLLCSRSAYQRNQAFEKNLTVFPLVFWD